MFIIERGVLRYFSRIPFFTREHGFSSMLFCYPHVSIDGTIDKIYTGGISKLSEAIK